MVGVARGATALHKTLKDNGFRWSTATTSWNLPKDMDEHTRAARVSELLSTVRANGRDLPVVNDPAPLAAANRSSVTSPATAGAPPAASVTTAAPACGSVAVNDTHGRMRTGRPTTSSRNRNSTAS